MKRVGTFYSIAAFILSFHSLMGQTVVSGAPVSNNDSHSNRQIIQQLKKKIPVLLKEADLPGLSIAIIRKGALVYTGAFGVSNNNTKKPVTANTVFEAASLSKPVFAYAVMKLVDQGKLNLDSPLNKYLGNNYSVENDDRINLITARMVLSHTSGFPNWRWADGGDQLKIHFKPGEKFSYSGEGFFYLGKVVEKITGLKFQAFMQETVFTPLGMRNSSYLWRNSYDSLKAYGHDQLGNVSGRNQPADAKEGNPNEIANPAASLCTTPGDYARFLIALIKGTGLQTNTHLKMLEPQVRVDNKFPDLAWGLGIGLETTSKGNYIWHWGDNGDAKAYTMAFLPTGDAVVYFAAGANGLSITQEILDIAIGGTHPAIAFNDYEKYNAASRLLLKSIYYNGAEASLAAYRNNGKDTTQRLTEAAMNSIGYALVGMKKNEAALAVFLQNTSDHPFSWNTWDSLGEMYMNSSNKGKAIECYEKSLQLNPENSNAATLLKKLKQ